MHVDVVGNLEKDDQEYLSSTLVNVVSGLSNVADNVRLPNESPFKRSVAVGFVFIEGKELMFEVNQSRKKRKSNDGDCSRAATSMGGLTAENGLSEMD